MAKHQFQMTHRYYTLHCRSPNSSDNVGPFKHIKCSKSIDGCSFATLDGELTALLWWMTGKMEKIRRGKGVKGRRGKGNEVLHPHFTNLNHCQQTLCTAIWTLTLQMHLS